MGLYNKQGLLNGYKKNNKEREELDYYATPPQEVTNILNKLALPLANSTVLEPSCGGGHMLLGIEQYIKENNLSNVSIFASDVMDRGNVSSIERVTGQDMDFLSDDYPYNEVDYVIMNPPFTTIEPFVIRGLEIAQKGLLVLGRLQFLETKSRYENLLKYNPPTETFVYVDRIKCFKNGDFSKTESSAQAYAWFYWDKTMLFTGSLLNWIRKVD